MTDLPTEAAENGMDLDPYVEFLYYWPSKVIAGLCTFIAIGKLTIKLLDGI